MRSRAAFKTPARMHVLARSPFYHDSARRRNVFLGIASHDGAVVSKVDDDNGSASACLAVLRLARLIGIAEFEDDAARCRVGA